MDFLWWPFPPWHPFRPTPAPLVPTPLPSDEVAQQLLAVHNIIRTQRGLKPLTLNNKLNSCAQVHSQDQATHGVMSHTGSDGSTPFQRMTKAGYNYSLAGENIAWNYPDVTSVMNGWMQSIGHRENILRVGFVDFGAACVNGYWTCDFGAPQQVGSSNLVGFFPGLLENDRTN